MTKSFRISHLFSQGNTDLLRCLRISKGEYKGNRDIERQENSPVDCFQWFERPENSPVESF